MHYVLLFPNGRLVSVSLYASSDVNKDSELRNCTIISTSYVIMLSIEHHTVPLAILQFKMIVVHQKPTDCSGSYN